MILKFGQQIARSIGTVLIRLPKDDYSHLTLKMQVVNLNIPLIIGLDILKHHSVLVNNVDNTLFRILNLCKPLVYKRGHVFSEWEVHLIMYTREELNTIHMHFMNPAADLLLELIRGANHESATSSVREQGTPQQNIKSLPLM